MKGIKKRFCSLILVLTLIVSNVMLVNASNRITSFSFGTDKNETSVTFWAEASLNADEILVVGYIAEADKTAGSTQMPTVTLQNTGGNKYEATVTNLSSGRYYADNVQIIKTSGNTHSTVETCTTIDNGEHWFTIRQSSGSGNQSGICNHTFTWIDEVWTGGYYDDSKSCYVQVYDQVTRCSDCPEVLSSTTVERYEYGVNIIGYATDITFRLDEGNGFKEVIRDGFYTKLMDNGQTIAEQVDGMFKIEKNPTKAGATFEGWAKFYWKTDDEGMSYAEFQQKSASQPYYTISEMLHEKVTANVDYVAKWSDIPIEEYYNYSHTIDISAYADEAEFSYELSMYDEEKDELVWVEQDYSFGTSEMLSGVTLDRQLKDTIRIEKEPTKAGATFEGWAKFKLDSETGKYIFVPQSDAKQYYTTDEMLASVMPAYDVSFAAKWSDISIEDYFPVYYQLVMDANGGEIISTQKVGDNESYTYVEKVNSSGIAENKSIEETFEKDNIEITNIGRTGKVLDSWKVYQAEAIGAVWVESGKSVEAENDEMVVYYDSWDGEDIYFIISDYKLVDAAMSTDKLFTACKNNNYYAIANWKDSVSAIEDVKVKESLSAEGKTLVDSIMNGPVSEEFVSKETQEKVKDYVQGGFDIDTELIVYPIRAEFVDAVEQKEIENTVKSLGEDTTMQYLDIQVLLKAEDEILGNINKLKKPIELTITIPEEMRSPDATYKVVRYHESDDFEEKVQILDGTLGDNYTYVFTTAHFSTYALVCIEDGSMGGSTSSNVPKTGDSNMFLEYTALSMLALATVVGVKRRYSYGK